MIPMKGKGHQTTARNILLDEPSDLSRPLMTDVWDNMLYEQETETSDDKGR